MADKKTDPNLLAFEAVYAALKELDPAGRRKILSSVSALLDLEVAPPTPQRSTGDDRQIPFSGTRPPSLVELINEKKPGTNTQYIALFAYYREKVEGLSRFARDDLKSYFAKAKAPPAGNFDRDFVEAVRKGWIHEEGSDSYLTTKGVEAVESGFEGERKHFKARRGSAGRSAKRSKSKKKRKA